MKETINITSHSGHGLTLLGEPTVVGTIAPDVTLTDATGKDVKISDYKGKTVLISVFPSIDTPVCATSTREFNKRVTTMSKDTVVLCVSKDLPFALGRFCGAEGLTNVHTLSDYKASEFGLKYGFLLKENQLLGRGVVVIDKTGKIVYVEYVSDIVNEPNYDAAIAKL